MQRDPLFFLYILISITNHAQHNIRPEAGESERTVFRVTFFKLLSNTFLDEACIEFQKCTFTCQVISPVH